ncbi:MAG: family 78 glycoside hydrolase catalytic domain [Lacipirellulaceae bacterium]
MSAQILRLRGTAALPLAVLLSGFACAAINPVGLRVEALVDPVGVEAREPEFSWRVESRERDQSQSAYQVQVARSPQALGDAETPDLWDSGRVAGGATYGVVYAGKPLASHSRCFWRVRVWDAAGLPSAWSVPSTWTMGVLAAEEWRAQWIGDDQGRVQPPSSDPLVGASWIAHPDDPGAEAPASKRLFVGRLTIPRDAVVERATAVVVADDVYSLAINGHVVAHELRDLKLAKPTDIGGALIAGENEVRVRVTNDAPSPTGLVLRITVELQSGDPIEIVTDGEWSAVAEPGDDWQTRALGPDAPRRARVAGEFGCEPWGKVAYEPLFVPAVPRFRKEFVVSKPIDHAVLYVTALGTADAHLNARRVSEDRFTPGWTDYRKRVYRRAYDVTDRLVEGANALGAELADGWYSGYVGWRQIRNHYGKQPRVAMQLVIQYADGSTETVSTDDTWRATSGPTTEADFLMGESYDARLEEARWCAAGFDDSAWRPVTTGAEVSPLLHAHPGPPVVEVQEFRASKVTQPSPGRYVYDLGQNFAGVVKLRVQAPRGAQVRLRFAERLNPDGTLYTTNLRQARVVDTYVCRGGGAEEWTPRFTFHGFQFVEVSGLPSPPTIDTVTGIALSSDTPRAGSFECSDPELNQLASNVYWTQRSNFLDVPTDCPQRDERLGWTGDAMVYTATATLQADVQAFYRKWLVDLDDAQRADGQFPMVAPLIVAEGDGGPAWADAGVVCPWEIYLAYGDRRTLEAHYPAMKRFVEFCKARSVDGVLPPKDYHCFGDWLSIGADTPKDVIYTAYFAHSARLLSRSARALGNEADAAEYEALHLRVKRAFNATYVKDDGSVLGETQCGYVLAIAFDLLEGERLEGAKARLVADIEAKGGRLSTGFIGTKDLMLALSKIGREDVACGLLRADGFPSWKFSIKHGATSIWERWDGWTPEKGFQDPGMNSFAHYSFGAVYQWMVENVGGIRRDAPGYASVTIAPIACDGIDWARVRYDSVRGPVRSAWRREGKDLVLDVSVPANVTATIQLAAAPADELLESGSPAHQALGVRGVRREASVAAVKVGSGDYSFRVRTAGGG